MIFHFVQYCSSSRFPCDCDSIAADESIVEIPYLMSALIFARTHYIAYHPEFYFYGAYRLFMVSFLFKIISGKV